MNDIEQFGIKMAGDQDLFTQFSYSCLSNDEFIPTPFDGIINETIDKIFTGEIKVLVVNMPPRKGKTLRFIHALTARGFAVNPQSAFVHTSYSDKLVLENSNTIKSIIESPDYQTVYPHVQFKADTTAKGLWRTTQGGSFLASSTNGAVTGFGAGKIGANRFYGALLIDDPVKPADARYETKRESANRFWFDTLRSRRADDNTPVVVIMQRVHPQDFTYTIVEESGLEVHHLVLPEYIEDNYTYDQSGIYIPHNLPVGSIWPEQRTDEEALKLNNNSIQYSQNPIEEKGEVYERDWFIRFDQCPVTIKEWSIWGDTATKTNDYNDYTVFQLWGLGTDNRGYMFDMFRGKVEVPQLFPAFKVFYNQALSFTEKPEISINIEDKDSGSGLIQLLNQSRDDNNKRFKVTALQRNSSKYARALIGADEIVNGRICIINNEKGDIIITEASKYKSDDSHKHDDTLDPMNDFCNFGLNKKGYVMNRSIL